MTEGILTLVDLLNIGGGEESITGEEVGEVTRVGEELIEGEGEDIGVGVEKKVEGEEEEKIRHIIVLMFLFRLREMST